MRRLLTAALMLVGVVLAVPGVASADALPRPTGPCDIYAAAGTPCVAAHSTTRALYAAYTGPLYQVKRQSDGATQGHRRRGADGRGRGRLRRRGRAGRVLREHDLLDHRPLRPVAEPQRPHPGAARRVQRPGDGRRNNLPIADMAPITVGGHKAYGVFIEPGMGLRNNNPTGTAVDDQPEDTVLGGQRPALQRRLLLRLRQRRDRQPRRRQRHDGDHVLRQRHRVVPRARRPARGS